MSAPVRGALFALALALVFALASLAGAAIDPPVDEASDAEHAGMQVGGSASEREHDSGQADHVGPASGPGVPAGLASAEAGYRLVVDRTRFEAGAKQELAFRVLDPAGEVVTDFDTEHERRMHLIVVRRDFTGFQHLHPRRSADGTWRTEADFGDAGAYRMFADFSVADRPLTLAADLFVAGRFQPRPLPSPSAAADAGHGYEVTIDSGEPTPGETAAVSFIISRDGRRLGTVQPYLGADGHLVALREHDQAFLHTHPEGEAGGAGPISFAVDYPTAGRYRLYLQFKHQGQVRTAAFTQEVGSGANAGGSSSPSTHSHEGER